MKMAMAFSFNHASVGDIHYSVQRAVDVYADKETFDQMRKTMMEIDNSWDKSAQHYIDVYRGLK